MPNRPYAIETQLLAQVAAAMRSGVGDCSIEWLDQVELASDSTEKFVVLDAGGKRRGFGAMATAQYPRVVFDWLGVTSRIKSALGRDVGSVIMDPLVVGDVEGRSYSVTPYREGLSGFRPLRFLQRLLLSRRVWRWLRDAAAKTKRIATAQELETRFAIPLRNLVCNPAIGVDVRGDAERALGQLRSGVWRPVLSLCHGDFWEGNLLLAGDRNAYGIHVIDWGGARLDGHAVYDWIRYGCPRGVSRRCYRRVLDTLFESLSLTDEEARHVLLAGLGDLHSQVGAWPEASFLETVESTYKQFNAVIAP